MDRPNDEHGEEIQLSGGKNTVQLVIGAVAGVGGGLLGLRFAVLVITTNIQGDMPRWVELPLGFLCGLFSLALLGMGVFTIGRAARLLSRRVRFYLDDTHLRCVSQDGEVLVHVPYDNIADIRFVEDEDYHHGPREEQLVQIRKLQMAR
jgi:hypothetical protein